MCGIFALLNATSDANIHDCFQKGTARGPEYSALEPVGMKITMGFHRLAINGLHASANQPLRLGDRILICNGEIYNYRELYALLGPTVVKQSESDCEIILHLYERYGMTETLALLDGEFAFVLLDQSAYVDQSVLYVARDPYGVRPLYHYAPKDSTEEGFASEMKMLTDLSESSTIEHVIPGTVSTYQLSTGVHPTWSCIDTRAYHLPRPVSVSPFVGHVDDAVLAQYCDQIHHALVCAVNKRLFTTERPVACLLSGGLDSSLVASIACNLHESYARITGKRLPPIETYSIGLADSEDLKYARQVADHIGSQHTEIVLSEQDFLDAIPEVIRAIESYDTTTVRASIGNYLLGKYIRANSNAKVILNGDGSDEVAGGYLYMHVCPDAIEFDRETRRLLREIHAFDVLRSDKSISSHGLEPRTPFLDRDWVDTYLSIPPDIRFHPGRRQCEKYLIRRAFSPASGVHTVTGKSYLPDTVLWRRKEAFSDGVSKTSRSLYVIIQEYTDQKEDIPTTTYAHNPPQTSEQRYYRAVFEEAYPSHGNVVPHFWMPKYVNARDASARTW
jgi:asparagine synthase (glutamine-hydrolysing)